MKVSKETPLSEITLRKYEKPIKLKEREIVKKLCLSLGLLQPGDSRDIIVDIFHVILKSKKSLTCTQIEKKIITERKKNKLPLLGIAQSNIRRQLRRLKDLFLIEKSDNAYRIFENEKLSNIYKERIKQFYIESISARIREYCEAADKI